MSADSTSDARDCGGDAAAHALGALDRSEAEAFRRHLNGCVVCRDEIAAFGQVVDALGAAAPRQFVPPGLRERVMRDVRMASTSGRRSPRRRRPPLLSRPYVLRPALAAVVVAAMTLAILGAFELGPGGSGGMRLIRAAVTAGPGNAELRETAGHAELLVNHLPPPPVGRIYELWVKRGHQAPTPIALFSATSSGTVDVGVAGDVRAVNTIMVTQEPWRGSLVPTGAPLIVVHLT